MKEERSLEILIMSLLKMSYRIKTGSKTPDRLEVCNNCLFKAMVNITIYGSSVSKTAFNFFSNPLKVCCQNKMHLNIKMKVTTFYWKMKSRISCMMLIGSQFVQLFCN